MRKVRLGERRDDVEQEDLKRDKCGDPLSEL